MNFLFVYLLYSKNDYNSTDTSVEGNLRVVIYISDYCVVSNTVYPHSSSHMY